MMNKQRKVRGGQHRATICNNLMFFLVEDPSNAKPVTEEDREEWALGIALAHYSIGVGIKKFRERGKARVTKELPQMHDMNVFQPVARELLSKEERAKALTSLMFLKEKRDKSVKARMCAKRRKQRGDWTKQDTTSPTILMEVVFITAVIEVHEERNVACFDIPGAFLHADLDKDITMNLKGRLAELMVKVAPNFHTLCQDAESNLWASQECPSVYNKLVADLEGDRFVMNPYDPCVANKMVNRKQMTVCWHVDDLKALQVNPGEITIFGEWLNATYGVTIATHRGKVHNYLGMIFDYSKKGKAMVNMIKYIKNII